MASRDTAIVEITPEVLLKAYACGIFPMAESADDPALYWIEPEQRGIIPLDRLSCAGAARPHGARHAASPSSANRDFDAVIDGCAAPAPGRCAHLDQRSASAGSIAGCSTSAIATPSRSTTATRWSAGSMA